MEAKQNKGTLVSLIPWKIYFHKVTSVAIIDTIRWMNLLFFVKSSYQRDLCLASMERIKPSNAKVEQRQAIKIVVEC